MTGMGSVQSVSPLEAFAAGYLYGTGVSLSQSLALASAPRQTAPGQQLAQELPGFMDDQATAVKFYTDLMQDAQEAGLGDRTYEPTAEKTE